MPEPVSNEKELGGFIIPQCLLYCFQIIKKSPPGDKGRHGYLGSTFHKKGRNILQNGVELSCKQVANHLKKKDGQIICRDKLSRNKKKSLRLSYCCVTNCY